MPPAIVARLHTLTGGEGREHKNKFGSGISPVYDQDGKVAEVRFSQFSAIEEARRWLDDHNYAEYRLEGEQRHYLAFEFTDIPEGNIIEKDGGLLVKGVKLLAAGTWTDSYQKTPCRYTLEKLQKYAGNWNSLDYWSRHGGGTPRGIGERIADIISPRFEGDAVVADLFFDGITQNSLDAIRIIQAAAAGKRVKPFSSVEMWTRDIWIPQDKVYEAQEILFDGAAMVNRGACAVCTFPGRKQQAAAPVQEAPAEPHNLAGSAPAPSSSNEGSGKEKEMKKDQQAPDGSLEAVKEKLRDALTDKFGIAGQDGQKWGVWIVATYPDRVVYEATQDSRLYEVTYSVAESGEVLFGTPYEVKVIYQRINPEPTENTMETKDYEAKIAELTRQLEDAKNELKAFKEAQAAAPAAPAASADNGKELEAAQGKITALEARVKELENKPNPKTPGATTSPDEGGEKALEEPAYRVTTSKTGEVFRS